MTPTPSPRAASPDSTVRRLLLVFGALLLLLALTIAAAQLDLGPLATPLALLVAGSKTVLIAIWFMQLRAATGLVRLAAATGLVFFTIALSFTWLDYVTRTG